MITSCFFEHCTTKNQLITSLRTNNKYCFTERHSLQRLTIFNIFPGFTVRKHIFTRDALHYLCTGIKTLPTRAIYVSLARLIKKRRKKNRFPSTLTLWQPPSTTFSTKLQQLTLLLGATSRVYKSCSSPHFNPLSRFSQWQVYVYIERKGIESGCDNAISKPPPRFKCTVSDKKRGWIHSYRCKPHANRSSCSIYTGCSSVRGKHFRNWFIT